MSFYLTAHVFMKHARLLKIGSLKRAFAFYGMPVSTSWIRRQEEKGNLFLPRSSTNFKRARGYRKPGAVRELTRDQIEAVLVAFLPKGTQLENGKKCIGTGYYNYLA